MKIGIKIFPDRQYQLDNIAKIADFVEIMATPRLRKVKKSKIPFTVHAPHQRFKVNFADKKLEKRNLKLMKHTIKIADKLNAKTIVVHTGKILNKHCSTENALNIIKKLDDPRILVENLHEKYGFITTPNGLKEFAKEAGCGICFDFSHAIVSAHNLGLKSYKPFIKQFLKLKPKYFHVCDGFYDGKDRHLDLGTGKYDLSFIKKCIGNKPVALEIKSHKVNSYKKQIELLKNGTSKT